MSSDSNTPFGAIFEKERTMQQGLSTPDQLDVIRFLLSAAEVGEMHPGLGDALADNTSDAVLVEAYRTPIATVYKKLETKTKPKARAA